MRSMSKKAMNYFIFFGLILLTLFQTSCEKNNGDKEGGNALLGKWQIQSDTSFAGIGLNNHAVTYTGQTDDFFNFRADGTLWIEENGKLTVLDYSSISNTSITITSFLNDSNGATSTCTVKEQMRNAISISSPILLTPGGTFGRIVHLSR